MEEEARSFVYLRFSQRVECADEGFFDGAAIRYDCMIGRLWWCFLYLVVGCVGMVVWGLGKRGLGLDWGAGVGMRWGWGGSFLLLVEGGREGCLFGGLEVRKGSAGMVGWDGMGGCGWGGPM